MKTVIASLFEDRRKRMGRPPCCEKVGIKKGPWTPEEDIVLVSYIQQHGPGNWRAVPTNTGLLRCSKSCRLRWTNYLRPGIKRGNFTSHEEGMIVHLQALLGNKWAAIASYLPQRTDNDIKNYWNTHLKKKLNKNMETNSLGHHGSSSILDSTTCDLLRNPTRDDANHIASSHAASTNLVNQSISSTSSYCGGIYASSTENISRLLEGWMRTSPKSTNNANIVVTKPSPNREENPEGGGQHQDDEGSCGQGWPWAKAEKTCAYGPQIIINRAGPAGCGDHDLLSREANKTSMVPFDNLNSVDAAASFSAIIPVEKKKHIITGCDVSSSVQPLSFLEKWLLEEGVGGQVLEDRMMAVSGYLGLS